MKALTNCHGRPDPVLLDLNEARRRGITCRHTTGHTLDRLQRVPLHPCLARPARMAALQRQWEREQAERHALKGAA